MVVTLSVLPDGFIGYKASTFEASAWDPAIYVKNASNDKDWSGLYIAEVEGTARGYLPDMVPSGTGSAYINKVFLNPKVQLITCMDETFKTGHIDLIALKAALRKATIEIKDSDLVMPTLGGLGFFFRCYNNEEGAIEVICPNNNKMVNLLSMKKYKKCELKKGEVVQCSEY